MNLRVGVYSIVGVCDARIVISFVIFSHVFYTYPAWDMPVKCGKRFLANAHARMTFPSHNCII